MQFDPEKHMFILVDENFNVINPEGAGLALPGNEEGGEYHSSDQRLDLIW